MAETFYRKYRPKDFASLFGQKHIKKLLENAVEKDAVSHAYIFSGPRGTGKTTVARILAKRLNCENPGNFEPCNVCSQCRNITSGNHMDVIEMDAASNRGIDDFRSIRDKVSYKPVEGKYKVYIIDEVHMLTTEAFNAILKTLEEPPDHVVFILATTNPEKIPETIISRCQLLPFKNLSPEDIEDFMRYVCENEHISISPEALKIISDYSRGGMRDALVLLEQVSRTKNSEETVEYDDILQVIGGVRQNVIKEFLEVLINGKVGMLIELTENLYRQGVNFEVFLDSLSDYIVKNISEYDFKTIINIAQIVSELSKGLKFAENKKTLFLISFLGLMKEVLTHTDVPAPENRNEISAAANPLIELTEAVKTDTDKTPEKFFEEIKKKDISAYISLRLSNIAIEDNRIHVGENPEYGISFEVFKEKIESIKNIFSENGYEICMKEIEKSGADSGKSVIKAKDEKFESLSEDMKDSYRKLKTLFPGKEIIIKEITS